MDKAISMTNGDTRSGVDEAPIAPNEQQLLADYRAMWMEEMSQWSMVRRGLVSPSAAQ